MIDDYSGLQKAAILLITLGPEKASEVRIHVAPLQKSLKLSIWWMMLNNFVYIWDKRVLIIL